MAGEISEGVELAKDILSVDTKSAIIIVLMIIIAILIVYIAFSKVFDRIRALEKEIDKRAFVPPPSNTFSSTHETPDSSR